MKKSAYDYKKHRAEFYAAADAFAYKVAPLYKHHEWEWAGKGIPSAEAISDHLINSYESMDTENRTYESMGRIIIKLEVHDLGNFRILLEP